jgi:predicted N-formylglutamate amidohydrolase
VIVVRARTPLLLTCEHGGNRVPAAYGALFRGAARTLASHRGHDLGALHAARSLARALDAPLLAATVTRLLVDLNRSRGHPALHSEFTAGLAAEERERIVRRHYDPWRGRVVEAVAAAIARHGCVLHVSVHSFTPVLGGVRRRADLGLLYDPARAAEARFCRRWQAALAGCADGWAVRRNYPYRGTSDGQVVELRRRFGARYAGVELEINQALLVPGPRRARLLRDLARAFPEPR